MSWLLLQYYRRHLAQNFLFSTNYLRADRYLKTSQLLCAFPPSSNEEVAAEDDEADSFKSYKEDATTSSESWADSDEE
jgi:hypothetical protein